MEQNVFYIFAQIALWLLSRRDANVPKLDACSSELLDEPWLFDEGISYLEARSDVRCKCEGSRARSFHSPRSWITRASIADPRNSVWALSG